MDDLAPLFQDIAFNERFRGYDVAEVDAYIDRVAKAAALVQGRIAELERRAEATEAHATGSSGADPVEAGGGEPDQDAPVGAAHRRCCD